MFKYLVRCSYSILMCVASIGAMQQGVPESLKVQSLKALVMASEISREQIDQLPQEIQKVARLLRYTKGNVNKAFLKALSLRNDIGTIIFKAACVQNNGVIPISIELDGKKLFEQGYSLEDICMLIECGVDVYNVSRDEQLAFINNIHPLDQELLSMLYDKFYIQNTIEGHYSMPFLTSLCKLYNFSRAFEEHQRNRA